jgi:hypothetical protein
MATVKWQRCNAWIVHGNKLEQPGLELYACCYISSAYLYQHMLAAKAGTGLQLATN